jgi:hypothetical protein
VDLNEPLTNVDWLAFPQQRLLEMTRGRVFHDGLGALTLAREKFTYFPRDVWLYVLASQWSRVAQEEAFVGRTGDLGDELGSGIVASRIVRSLMQLCFLIEKAYWPYSKWFGTAFKQLQIAPKLEPLLLATLSASWRDRERHLVGAYTVLAQLHNALGLTEKLPTAATTYFARRYLVIQAERFATALQAEIGDSEIRSLNLAGSVDQISDSTEVFENIRLSKALILACHQPIRR